MGSLLSKCAFSTPINYTRADHLQHVDHVHFHVVPKPNPKEGLILTIDENWPQRQASKDELAATLEKMKSRI